MTRFLDKKIPIARLQSVGKHFLAFPAALSLLYGLVNTVANDTVNYEIIWSLLYGSQFFESFFQLRYEFGSLFILWSLANSFSASSMVFLTGVIALSVKYYLFNKYLNYSLLAFLLYALAFVHIVDANQLRLALATCVVFYALFTEPRSRYTYFFLTVVAVLFHYQGIIILFLYFTRWPVLAILVCVLSGFIFDSIVTSFDVFQFAMIWRADPDGNVNLTNSFFIMQCFLGITCAVNWKRLSDGQKRGALINMVGIAIYLSFLDNAIVAHRMRELSQMGFFAILFLGHPRLTSTKLVAWLVMGYFVLYNSFLIYSELLLII